MEWADEISIGRYKITQQSPAFVIAEIGSNHNQDIELAKYLIEESAHAGANAVKFQSLKLTEVHHIEHVSEDFKEFFQQIELAEQWHHELQAYAQQCQLEFISTPTYYKAIQLLQALQVPAIKIASAQFGIHPWLVEQAAATGIPLIASTGLANFAETANQLERIAKTGNNKLILLHCVSQYPTEHKRANLAVLQYYKNAFKCLVGYSDHTQGIGAAPLAVALGARVIEKHITKDRSLKGPDHHYAIEPHEFKAMVARIREAEELIGVDKKALFNDEEESYRDFFRYKCVTDSPIVKGQSLSNLELQAKRAEGGIDVRNASLLYKSFKAATDIPAGKLLEWQDIEHA